MDQIKSVTYLKHLVWNLNQSIFKSLVQKLYSIILLSHLLWWPCLNIINIILFIFTPQCNLIQYISVNFASKVTVLCKLWGDFHHTGLKFLPITSAHKWQSAAENRFFHTTFFYFFHKSQSYCRHCKIALYSFHPKLVTQITSVKQQTVQLSAMFLYLYGLTSMVYIILIHHVGTKQLPQNRELSQWFTNHCCKSSCLFESYFEMEQLC